jgi:hypothetical protein
MQDSYNAAANSFGNFFHISCRTVCLIVAALLICWLSVCPCNAADEKTPTVCCRLSFFGEVWSQLTDQRIVVDDFKRNYPFSGGVKDFPAVISFEKDLGLFIAFKDSADKRIFCLAVPPNTLRDQKDLTIALRKPDVSIQVYSPGRHSEEKTKRSIRISCCAQLDNHVQYADLPYWDRQKKVFSAAKDPQLEVVAVDKPDRVLLEKTVECGDYCRGFCWETLWDLPPEVPNGRKLRITVTHDTGDLWGVISTTTEFSPER